MAAPRLPLVAALPIVLTLMPACCTASTAAAPAATSASIFEPIRDNINAAAAANKRTKQQHRTRRAENETGEHALGSIETASTTSPAAPSAASPAPPGSLLADTPIPLPLSACSTPGSGGARARLDKQQQLGCWAGPAGDFGTNRRPPCHARPAAPLPQDPGLPGLPRLARRHAPTSSDIAGIWADLVREVSPGRRPLCFVPSCSCCVSSSGWRARRASVLRGRA